MGKLKRDPNSVELANKIIEVNIFTSNNRYPFTHFQSLLLF
ncbi:hypothetical protein ACLQ7P_22990 (plasmid) [Bacillus subtilis subsp. subtilis]